VTRVRVVLDPKGMAALAAGPEVSRYVGHVTDVLRDSARAGSPRYTGHFAESFATDVTHTATGAVGTLANSDVGATSIEFGSIHNAPFAPMRRAVRALGLRLEESR
jgi:hypothetical protein